MHPIAAPRLLSGCALVAALALIALPVAAKDAVATAPGVYQDWNDEIDRVEIVETFRIADYQRLVVEDFETTGTPLPESSDNTYEPVREVLADVETSLVEGLREAAGETLAVESADAGAASQAGVLVLRGRVLEMDPGSRAARYWGGFGAGAARSKLAGELVDAATGRVLLRFTQERRSGVGMAGGDYVNLMRRNLRKIGEDLGNGLRRF